MTRSISIEKNVSLTDKHTLALQSRADFFYKATTEEALVEAIQWARQNHQPVWILGGGSNVLFPARFEGLVLQMALEGISLLEETDDAYKVQAKAGVGWDDFLQVCMKNGWHGLDNLAIIPGTVGAAPVQNIGAYGQEVANCITVVRGFNLESQAFETLSNEECQFRYRHSIFKAALKNKFVITAVDFEFHKQARPHLQYAPLNTAFEGAIPGFEAVRQQVIEAREAKLPSPNRLANCGSFFKNPVVSKEELADLQLTYPAIPYYAYLDDVKLSAGWLIEQAGFKGFREGPVGMYEYHALVLVNYADAQLADVEKLSSRVVDAVRHQFSVLLEREPCLAC